MTTSPTAALVASLPNTFVTVTLPPITLSHVTVLSSAVKKNSGVTVTSLLGILNLNWLFVPSTGLAVTPSMLNVMRANR